MHRSSSESDEEESFNETRKKEAPYILFIDKEFLREIEEKK